MCSPAGCGSSLCTAIVNLGPVTNRDPFQTLLKYAQRHCVGSKEQAQGVSFHASVQLAKQAQKLGLSELVTFVHWRVGKDPDFREHWALHWRDGLVLDMTAVQVFGDSDPLRPLDAYPANFSGMRQYKLETVLGCKGSLGPHRIDRYSRRQLLKVHARMTWADLAKGCSHGSVVAVLCTPLRFLQTSLILFAGYVFEWAMGRLSLSLTKLK